MFRQRGIRIAKFLFALMIAIVGFMAAETLTSGVIPKAQAVCPCKCPFGSTCTGPPHCFCILDP